MECRAGCGVCCIAPSISQAYANMPQGKKAGELCANLDPATFYCRIWGLPEYPDFCHGFQPERDFCGSTRDEAVQIMTLLESSTQPEAPQ